MLKICLWLAVMVSFLTACRSYREVTMLADVDRTGQLDAMSSPMGNYRLRAKDNLYVSVVSSNPEMNRVYNPAQSGTPNQQNNNYEGETNRNIYGYEVDDKGIVTLPLLGTFEVGGKTLRETEELVQRKAAGLFKDVTAKVRLLNYKVTVVGEVKRPGVYYNYDSDFTVIDAIGRAEGITEFAQINDVLVLRQSGSRQNAHVVNLNNKNALRNDGFYLLPDDTVIIKPGKNKNRQMNASAQNWIIPAVSAVLVLVNFLRNN